MKCGLYENIARNLIFIDGVSRSGKALFNGIIPSLENIEHLQIYILPELFLPAVSLGLVDIEYARAVLRIHMNELVYNIRLSRNVNFRLTDETGIFNYSQPQLYYERLLKKEGDAVVEELRSDDRFTFFHAHDLMVNLKCFNKLGIDYKMMEIFRNPVDNCYSWWTRGWGERFGVDPRSFTFCIDHKGKIVPWYCAGYEEEWLRLNPMERCVRMVTDLVLRSVKQYKESGDKSRIHVLTFEDFVQRPEEELEKICSFLGTRMTDYTPHFIHKAKCPRVLNPKDREKKLTELKAVVSKRIFDLLMETTKSYEKDLYGIR